LAAIVLSCHPASSAAVEVAQRYVDYCSVCHGETGQGALHAQQGMVIDTFMRGGQKGQTADEVSVPEQRATAIYRESCSVCHGDDGSGAEWGRQSLSARPRDFTSASAVQELTRDRMIAAVTYGRPGSPMPGFGAQLSPAQIAGVVDYVRTRFMSGQVAGGDNPVASGAYHDRSFPNGLVGRFERGRAFYMGNCVACHGIEGDGNGPRAYFIFPRPRSFIDPATREILNRPTLFNGIKDGVNGREMPAWGKVLGDQDIVDIAEYVYRQFIRPGPE
jgi:mono/diheme cytochrome c family protein